ncbi:MAG: hypothetical protein A2W99_07455 [Bacteroidetes bacterium GWF2_33_16]|nr:MAG: hypothetical protein A2X00_10405 [Bacteroidetes bacterium GWE2_32_14]OFY03044.1 MAG: hypothetical protein A2W99_07455 [Bacteroidetes bacterium GWF2_33_16]
MKKCISITLMITVFTTLVFSQNSAQTDTLSGQTKKQDLNLKHFVGSTLFLFGNIGDSVNFFQLNYGYQLTQKDIIIAEAITWTYYEPLGTYGSSDKFYPGKVRAYGLGLGYQRFLWKKLYSTIEPTFFLQQFYDTDDKKIQSGFQLYFQFIVGYRIEFFKKRIFIEPAIALKYWPVNTNFPASFAAIEKGAPKYKFEPSLNFGFRF